MGGERRDCGGAGVPWDGLLLTEGTPLFSMSASFVPSILMTSSITMAPIPTLCTFFNPPGKFGPLVSLSSPDEATGDILGVDIVGEKLGDVKPIFGVVVSILLVSFL